MKLGLVAVSFVLVATFAGTALADESRSAATSEASVATNGPQAPIATFTAGKVTQAQTREASVSHVQFCRVTKSGEMYCDAPIAMCDKANRSAK